jgi:hypothetical protein
MEAFFFSFLFSSRVTSVSRPGFFQGVNVSIFKDVFQCGKLQSWNSEPRRFALRSHPSPVLRVIRNFGFEDRTILVTVSLISCYVISDSKSDGGMRAEVLHLHYSNRSDGTFTLRWVFSTCTHQCAGVIVVQQSLVTCSIQNRIEYGTEAVAVTENAEADEIN